MQVCHRVAVLTPLFLAFFGGLSACSDANSPGGGSLAPVAAKWFERAKTSYRAGDTDDARDAVKSALASAPGHPAVRVLAARVHLARLEYAEAIRLLQGVNSSDAHAIKGRAHWYAGDMAAAADELEALLADANVKDEWAKQIAKLARRGVERKPFEISGGLIAQVVMPRIRGSYMVVPVEIDGEQALAVVATGKGEVTVDSATRREPAWAQLRFAERIEIRNVPVLTEDLSGISKEVGAPIKAMLGINLLRRLHVTFDFGGEQFVVRTREPTPPPKATRVSVNYALGGAMILRVGFKAQGELTSPVLVNTQMPLPVTLDERGWKSTGLDASSIAPLPNERENKARSLTLPTLRLGAFTVPGVPAFYGPSFGDARAATGVDVEGALGSGLLANFRCTLAEGGRVLWIEDVPDDFGGTSGLSAPPTAAPGPAPSATGSGVNPRAPQPRSPAR